MFKHFADSDQIASFIKTEILDAMHNDLARMEESEEDYYTDEDRDEMRSKIADIETYFAHNA
jgi:hypothetical protein